MTADHTDSSPEDLYRTVRLIRRFEERAIDLVRAGNVASGIHPCIGQEAVAAGIGAVLRPDDIMLTSHRGHGHSLAKGSDPGRLLAEILGRSTGVARGRGGSFHPLDFTVGILGATGTLGHGVPIAAGVAWALAQDGTDRVAVCVFGDGAVNQGALLEGLNMAALWQVPAVFACENNLYATTVPVQFVVAGSITGRAAAFGIPASSHDGMDPETVRAAAEEAVARARSGGGPSFLEFSTYRYEGHHTFELNAGLQYRGEDEVAAWRSRDPVELQGGRVRPELRREIDAEVEAVIDAATTFALGSPEIGFDEGQDYLYGTKMPLRPGTINA
ncbi:MAG TPA: thiamine pyrophosphate-dependent dehydrogenase E1 component subunit alpha [Streptosporangiaceae bacterium]|nr:thiamine pyrophosphate-dependent dehydrogenase E1 component subunit alpha [Streptosporangiaceae bacterium]